MVATRKHKRTKHDRYRAFTAPLRAYRPGEVEVNSDGDSDTDTSPKRRRKCPVIMTQTPWSKMEPFIPHYWNGSVVT